MGKISEALPVSSMKKEFSMIQKLGGGSFGNVYLIKRKDTKEMMAAKHQKIRSEDDRRHIRREVEILDILDTRNPDIVTLIDYFESAQECVILTEYLLGGELFERISSSEYELTENKCKGFMRQVLTGLSFIHRQGIIHLDLKPNNIVCVSRQEEDHRVKIIDFGLARRLHGRDSIPINMCGTPEFISPEVMRCTTASTASDMWSIGVIIFMMVTGGYSPFYSRNKYKMQRRTLRGNYDIEQFQVSKSAKEIIRYLLIVAPEKRMSASECLLHQWLDDGSMTRTEPDMSSQVRILETAAMRRWLARRRWARACHIVRATIRLRLDAGAGDSREESPEYFSSEEVWL